MFKSWRIDHSLWPSFASEMIWTKYHIKMRHNWKIRAKFWQFFGKCLIFSTTIRSFLFTQTSKTLFSLDSTHTKRITLHKVRAGWKKFSDYWTSVITRLSISVLLKQGFKLLICCLGLNSRYGWLLIIFFWKFFENVLKLYTVTDDFLVGEVKRAKSKDIYSFFILSQIWVLSPWTIKIKHAFEV